MVEVLNPMTHIFVYLQQRTCSSLGKQERKASLAVNESYPFPTYQSQQELFLVTTFPGSCVVE